MSSSSCPKLCSVRSLEVQHCVFKRWSQLVNTLRERERECVLDKEVSGVLASTALIVV